MNFFHDCTVETGAPSAVATALVPPSLLMMSNAVIPTSDSENRNFTQAELAKGVIAPFTAQVHLGGVLTTAELLARLTERGIARNEIAKALGVHPSRVTEMFKGDRNIKLDEAAKLVSAFDLESAQSQRVSPLPGPIAKLIVLYVAEELRIDLQRNSALIEALSEDVRAFAEYVTDPRARESIDLAEAFFRAMRLRRPDPESKATQGTDSHSA